MNIYRVISENLSVVVPILDDGTGPTEDYAIAELIAATTRKQAIWTAWKSDKDSFTKDVRDMPKFSTKIVAKDVQVPEGIVSEHPDFELLWD